MESEYNGSEEAPGFREWSERRFGRVPMDRSGAGGPVDCHVGERKFIGRLPSPEFRAWRERRHRRKEASIARCLDRAGSAGPDRRKARAAAPSHDKT